MNHEQYLQEAVRLSINNVQYNNAGPFGALIVRNQDIIARGVNLVTATNDPTAHAEIVAIRNACLTLQTFELSECVIYCSCEPCPMCLAAIYWSRMRAVYYANTRFDAAKIGFDDSYFYEQMALPVNKRSMGFYHMQIEKAQQAFELWNDKSDKIKY